MESAEIMAPLISFARFIDKEVLPTAVGPVKITNGFLFTIDFLSNSTVDYTILLNIFSNSYCVKDVITGLP